MEIMDKNARQKYAVVCFLPAVAFLITLTYYAVVIAPAFQTQHFADHLAITTLINEQGNLVMGALLLTFLITGASLVYCAVHIARVKYMNAPTKMTWLVFLIAFAPISLIFFYFFRIKREPRNLETYADIA